MKVKVSLKGISLYKYGDIIEMPWSGLWNPATEKYSHRLKSTFFSMPEYWKRIGVLEQSLVLSLNKVVGLDWEDILKQWIETRIDSDPYVVLFDVDLSSRPSEFWAKIPYEKKMAFNKDVVVMKCSNLNQAIEIAESILPNFGKAFIVNKGIVQ